MKTSTFAAVVFVVLGVFMGWQILQHKRRAEATVPQANDAGPPALIDAGK